MKKIIIILICVLMLIVCLIPRCFHLEDGGSVVYDAILYDVIKVHKLSENILDKEYIEGTRVLILGIEVYNDVE